MSEPSSSPPLAALTYREAGVDLDAAEQFTDDVRALAATTASPGVDVLSARGGFASLVGLPAGYVDPVIVASCDGVGTKLALALAANEPALVGRDLVAMCLNDVVTTGARPLLFLDYLATDKIVGSALREVVRGVAEACREAGCPLTGGETAEMPGLVVRGSLEVAGFAVGVVERGRILSSARVVAGDVLVGIVTEGLHANGFSLVRRVLADHGLSLDDAPADLGRPLREALLTPTPLYVAAARALADLPGDHVHALAHITGGGLERNVGRLLSSNLTAFVDGPSLERASTEGIIGFLARRGPIERRELRRTFPLGVGFVAAVAPAGVDAARAALSAVGKRSIVLGEVCTADDPLAPRVVFS